MESGIRYHDIFLNTDMAFREWHYFIENYVQAFQIQRAVEIPKDGTLHNPLEANFKDASQLSIANNYIETIVDASKGTFVEAVKFGYVKHHDNECMTNASIDRYAYTLMQDTKQHILRREKLIMMIGKADNYFVKHQELL